MPYICVELAGQKTFGGYLSIDNGQEIELFDDQMIFVEQGTHYLSFSSITKIQRSLTKANMAVGNYNIAAWNEKDAVDGQITYSFGENDFMLFTVVSDAQRHVLGQPTYAVKEFDEDGMREADRLYAEQQRMIAEIIKEDNKSNVTELLLCMFLGVFGVHKFYKKKIGMGILYLLTFGFFGIAPFFDMIKIIINLIKNK